MSMETREWLSTNTLIGFTEKRGNAWHYRQGDNNHYVGAVPVDDVLKRLFTWEPVKVPEQWMFNGNLVTGDDAVWLRSDTGAKLGTFTDGYQGHPYPEWLIDNVATLLDADGGREGLGISSVVLLKGGKIASVQVEVPETFTGPAGVEFRPFLSASTSFDGSISTQYGRMITHVVCDNTLSYGLNEKGQKIKIRHTRNSLAGKVAAAREALELIHSAADDFAAEVEKLTALELTEKSFEEIVSELTKVEDETKKRSVTMSQNKRDKLMGLRSDERVAPWWGTAFGGVQLLNTYRQHVQTVKGATRPERNMLNSVLGNTETEDAKDLQLVLAHTG